MRLLITGVAGFIGFHVAQNLLAKGIPVTGVDNLNSYYDVNLKKDRLSLLKKASGSFYFEHADLADSNHLHEIFSRGRFTHVINMAAQAGVRYSLVNPASYLQSNLLGFGNLLEECRKAEIQHLVFASSSSVYGLNTAQPYSVHDNTNHPVSLYAATKKSNELMAHSYSHLYRIPMTGLRFFTVYGPWGRPDMSPYIFTSAILEGKPIRLFNYGNLQRDYTYIDDITYGIAQVLFKPPQGNPKFDPAHPDPATSPAPWRIYNIGQNHTIPLREFVGTLEDLLGKKAIIEYAPSQPGDVQSTLAETGELARDMNFVPSTPLRDGLATYVDWHKDYYGKKEGHSRDTGSCRGY